MRRELRAIVMRNLFKSLGFVEPWNSLRFVEMQGFAVEQVEIETICFKAYYYS